MVKLVELPEGTSEVDNAPPTEPQTASPTSPEKQVPSPPEQVPVQQEASTASNDQCAPESQPAKAQTEESIPIEGSCTVDADSEPFVMLPDETIVASDVGNINPGAELEPGEMDLIDPSTLDEETGANNPDNNVTNILESINHFDNEQGVQSQTTSEQDDKEVIVKQQCHETVTHDDKSETTEVEAVTNDATGSTTKDTEHQVQNIESENDGATSGSSEPAKQTEKSTKEKIMELQEIQSVLDKINADIHNIKDKVDDSKPEKSKADKFEDDFKAIRMRNDALRQELISIKLAQNQRRQVDTSKFTEQKIIENTKLHQLKDSTCTLQNEVELITKARKAQEHLKQVQQERKAAAQKKLKEALAAERGPCGVKEIQQSIDTLKGEMELIINSPISEIVPDEENTATETSEDGQTKPVNKNKKAHDDMMKKYVLMQVMKNNIKELTKKMNDIMAAEGVTPVTPGKSSDTTEEKAVEVQEPTPDVKEEDGQDDEYYMHDDEAEGNASDLYEEDDNEEEETYEQNKEIPTATSDTNQEPANEKLSIAESVAKSIAAVESVIYKNKDKDESPTADTSASEQEPKSNAQSSGKSVQAKSHKNRRGRKGKAPPENVLATIRITQQQQKQLEEMKKAAAAATAAKKDAEAINTSKIGTYNFLLKLQREMASMQIQMTKMQENLRAANKTLQHVLETEFADM